MSDSDFSFTDPVTGRTETYREYESWQGEFPNEDEWRAAMNEALDRPIRPFEKVGYDLTAPEGIDLVVITRLVDYDGTVRDGDIFLGSAPSYAECLSEDGTSALYEAKRPWAILKEAGSLHILGVQYGQCGYDHD